MLGIFECVTNLPPSLPPSLSRHHLRDPPSSALLTHPLRGAQPSGESFHGRYILGTSQLCSLMMIDTPNPLMSAPVAIFERFDLEPLSIPV